MNDVTQWFPCFGLDSAICTRTFYRRQCSGTPAEEIPLQIIALVGPDPGIDAELERAQFLLPFLGSLKGQGGKFLLVALP